MKRTGDSTLPDKIRLLVRQRGASKVVQTYAGGEIAKATKLIQALPFAPKSHKALLVPSLAELYDDEAHRTELASKSEEPTDFAWLDLESDDDAVIETVLSLFPIHPSTKEDVKRGSDDIDVAEIFPSCGYVCVKVAAQQLKESSLGGEHDEPMMVTVIAFQQFLLSIHPRPFAGGKEAAAHMESLLCSPASYAEPVSVFLCALISGIMKEYQKEPSTLLVDVDNVNEMVLQIQPSQCDESDMLRRIEDLRHKLSRVQTSFLAKERLVQQLLLPVMRRIFITADVDVAGRYQRLLSGLLLSIERLRKGRDVLNLSSMSLVGGVSMRLLQHCYWMDYLNSVMTQMSLVTMPISIIPGVFTMNVRVPFEESEGLTAFFVIAAVTAVVFLLGMIRPVLVYFRYKPPGPLVPSSLS